MYAPYPLLKISAARPFVFGLLKHKKGITLQYALNMDLREIFQNIPDRIRGDHFHVTL